MACPTCDNTMRKAGEVVPGIGLFWCPRCGTIKDSSPCDTGEAPSLPGRVAEFAGNLTEDHQELIDEFERLGVRDAITTQP